MPFQRPPRRPKYPEHEYYDPETGRERVDYGFDWHEIIKQEMVTRLVVTPYFDEASSLLAGAARLWQGRLGKGRLRGKELLSFAAKLRSDAHAWRKSGLGWADGNLYKRKGPGAFFRSAANAHANASGDEAGYYLSIHADSRRPYYLDDETWPKHPMAARRMVAGAIGLIRETDELIRVTGSHIYAGDTADAYEDALEELGESPCSEEPDPSLSDEAYACLRERAFLRACEGLCSTAARVIRCGDEKGAKPWWERAAQYEKAAKEAFAAFVDEAPNDEQAPLLSSKDVAGAYCHVDMAQPSAAQRKRAADVVSQLLAVYHRWLEEGYGPLALPEPEKKRLKSET